MLEQQVSAVAFVLTLALWTSLGEAASLMRQFLPRASHQLHKRDADFVEWGCPDLKCPPVASDCEMMEVIAFRYEHGECLGCPYCIDLPFYLYDARERRSLPDMDAAGPVDAADARETLETALSETGFQHHHRHHRRLPRGGAKINSPIVQNEICGRVTCPVSPPGSSCRHPGMLDGYLRHNIKCISCPACLDSHSQLL